MGTTPPTKRVRRRWTGNSPTKRNQILDAAVRLFLANGFDQTSMDAISAEAGVSKTTVYAYYADKLELFTAVLARSAQHLALQMDDSHLFGEPDPEQRLSQIVLAVLESTVAPEFLAFLRITIVESQRHPELNVALEDVESVDVLGLIGATLQEAASARNYEVAQPRMFATLLLRIAVSAPQLESLLFVEFRPSHSLLEAHAQWITTVFLRGLEPRPGEPRTVHPRTEEFDYYPWMPERP